MTGRLGAEARPVFKWLEMQAEPGPAEGGLAPTWNFDKYLISRTGELVGHWRKDAEPTAPDLTAMLQAELAKPMP